MYKGMMIFETFLRKLEQSYKGKAITVSDAKMDFWLFYTFIPVISIMINKYLINRKEFLLFKQI